MTTPQAGSIPLTETPHEALQRLANEVETLRPADRAHAVARDIRDAADEQDAYATRANQLLEDND